MNCGFSVSANGLAVQFHLFGGVRNTRSLTSFVRRPSGCAALMGRLHYRDQLLASLPPDRETLANDAALALASYDQWGIDGIRRLEGDYCVVLWDARSKQLLAARDPMGGFPIYWTIADDTFTAITEIAPLVSNGAGCLDPDFIADYLSLPLIATQDAVTEATIYKGIRRVMPGALLTVKLPGLDVRVASAWRWLDHVVDPCSDRTEDIAEQFRPLLRGAVAERIHNKTAAHFSGGMDSTAVALIADERIRQGFGEAPLHALSLVYNHRASLKGETAFIEGALAQHPSIVAHRIEADDLLPYDPLAAEPLADEPYAIIFARAQEQAVAETAAANGIDTILTGCGGDDVFDVAPYHIADMLRAGQFGGCWREAIAWGRAYGCDPWTMLQRFGLGPLFPAGLDGWLRPLLRRGRLARRDNGPATVAPWFLPSFARTHHMHERHLSQLRQLYGSCRPVGLSVSLASVHGLAADRRRWALAQRGIMLSHPFMDPRILSLALGVRLRCRPDADEQKPLLTRAMRDVLPDQIRRRRGKVNFNELYYRGLARNLPALEDLIRTSRIGEFDVIDRNILLDCLRQTALGCETSASRGASLNLTLSLLTWLSIREKTPPCQETSGETMRFPLQLSQTEELVI